MLNCWATGIDCLKRGAEQTGLELTVRAARGVHLEFGLWSAAVA